MTDKELLYDFARKYFRKQTSDTIFLKCQIEEFLKQRGVGK